MRCLHIFLSQTDRGHGGVANRMGVVCAIMLNGEQSLPMYLSEDSVGDCHRAGGTMAI